MFQVCTAAVTGTAGCVGTIPRQEPTPLRTAPITLSTLTPQVSPLLLGVHELNAYTRESGSQARLFILEKATKYCGEDGQWFRHPDTNRTWSNYTLCNENTSAKLKVGHERRSRALTQIHWGGRGRTFSIRLTSFLTANQERGVFDLYRFTAFSPKAKLKFIPAHYSNED